MRSSQGADREPTIKERVTASRAAQGLPPVITDPAAIERVATILLASENAEGNRATEPRRVA